VAIRFLKHRISRLHFSSSRRSDKEKARREIERCCFASIHFHQHKFLRLISRRRRSGLFALYPSLILNLPADFEICFASSDWIRIRIGRRSSEIIRNSCTSWQKIQNRASEASAPLSRLADRDRSRISRNHLMLDQLLPNSAAKFACEAHPRRMKRAYIARAYYPGDARVTPESCTSRFCPKHKHPNLHAVSFSLLHPPR